MKILSFGLKGTLARDSPGSAIGAGTRRQAMAEEYARYTSCRNGKMHDREVAPRFAPVSDCVLSIGIWRYNKRQKARQCARAFALEAIETSALRGQKRTVIHNLY